MFRGFVTCEDAQGCNGFGDKGASAGRAANFCKTSPPANEEHKSPVLEKVLEHICRWFKTVTT